MPAYTPAVAPFAYRAGKILCVPRGAPLPPNCLKCGAPAQQQPWRKNFSYAPPLPFIRFFIKKSMLINVPLCERHYKKRKQLIYLGLLVAVVGLLANGVFDGTFDQMLGSSMRNSTYSLIGAAGFWFGLGLALYAGNYYLAPKLIDDFHGEFQGASEAFLQLLPPRAGL